MAASPTLRAKQVMQSREAAAGTRPWLLSLPTEGLMPTQPFRPAGIRPAGGTQSVDLWSACLGTWDLTVHGQLSSCVLMHSLLVLC